MPFNPVPLCLEAVARLLSFPVPLRLGTYGKGCKWMSVACLWLALSLVLQNTNEIRHLRLFPVPLLTWRGVARAVNDCAPCAFGTKVSDSLCRRRSIRPRLLSLPLLPLPLLHGVLHVWIETSPGFIARAFVFLFLHRGWRTLLIGAMRASHTVVGL